MLSHRSLLALAALCLATACRPEPVLPPSTVFLMDDRPITRDEIDELADAMLVAAPSYALPHRRRVALTDVLIPRARARSIAGDDARAQALERLNARVAAIEAGEEPEPELVTGTWGEMGLLTWLALRDTPVGDWSAHFEGPGSVARAKLLSRDGYEIPSLEVFECRIVWEDYTEGPFSRDPAQFGGHLEVVAEDQETWRELLPARWLYELEGHDR